MVMTKSTLATVGSATSYFSGRRPRYFLPERSDTSYFLPHTLIMCRREWRGCTFLTKYI